VKQQLASLLDAIFLTLENLGRYGGNNLAD